MHGGASVQTIAMTKNYSFFFWLVLTSFKGVTKSDSVSQIILKLYLKLSSVSCSPQTLFLTPHFSMANTLKQMLGKRN